MNVVALVVGLIPVFLSLMALFVHMVSVHRLKPLNALKSILSSFDALSNCALCAMEENQMIQKIPKILSDNKHVQSFSELKKDYMLNPVTNELEEKPLPVNIQDKIQSYIDCALERALERFMPKNVVESDDVADYTDKLADLASMADAFDVAEEYRERYGLSDKMSIAEIYDFVDKEAKSLREKIGQTVKKPKEDRVDEKK